MVSSSILVSSSSFSLHVLVILLTLPRNECTLKKPDCQNNGKLSIRNGKKLCICSSPFIGWQCEDVACVNGLSTGDQFDSSSVFFNKRCLCDPGWTGELCDKSLIGRCGTNGEDKNGKCNCRNGFVGDRCQYVTKCLHGQLFSGRCQCHYGWSGDFCDSIICHQGEPDEFNTACICPSKYRGRFCNFCAANNTSPAPECAPLMIPENSRIINTECKPIILALFITLLLVCSGSLCYFACQNINKRKTQLLMSNSKEEKADVKSQSPKNLNATINMEINSEKEKFLATSTPLDYDTIATVQEKRSDIT